jgi:hypothetical protein
VSAEAAAPPAQDDPLPSSSLPSGYRPPEEDDDVMSEYAEAGTVPTWVAASQRYVGQQLADLARAPGTPDSTAYRVAYERGAAEGLAELQSIVAKHAKQP